MNIFDPEVSSSRAATTPASPNSWSGNCKATCKHKSRSQKRHLLPHGFFRENLPGVPTQPTLKAPRPRGAPPPLRHPHKITPRSGASGRPTPRAVSHSSLTCPHPLTPQVADKSHNSLQLVYSVQVRKRSEQPRGPRFALQRRLCGTAECRLHEAQLRWQEAAGTSSVPASSKPALGESESFGEGEELRISQSATRAPALRTPRLPEPHHT